MNQISENNKENSSSPLGLKRKLTREKSILGASSLINTEQTVLSSPSIKHQLVKQYEDIDLSQFEFEMNNGDYVIYEYCNELVRKVQQAKEEQIEYLEDLSDKLMKKIEAFKQETTQSYLKKSDQLKEVFTPRLDKLRQKSSQMNLEHQKILLHKSIFSDKFLQFKREYSKVGSLKIHETNNIVDAKYYLEKIGTLNLSTELAEQLSETVYYRYFENGECLMGFLRYAENKIDFMVLNADKSVKVDKKTMNSYGNSFAHDIYVVGNKFIYQTLNGKVDIYDCNLKLLDRFENKYKLNPETESDYECDCILHYDECLCDIDEMVNTLYDKYKLIGACQSGLYFASKDYAPEIHVTDWSFQFIKSINASIRSEPHEFSSMKYHKEKYYYLDDCGMHILDKVNGQNKKVDQTSDSLRFEIDSNENLILFNTTSDNKKLILFYDLDGNLKFELNLKNFNSKKVYNILNKNNDNDLNRAGDSEEDDESDEYGDDELEWIQAFAINKASHLCYFDRQTLEFYVLCSIAANK